MIWAESMWTRERRRVEDDPRRAGVHAGLGEEALALRGVVGPGALEGLRERPVAVGDQPGAERAADAAPGQLDDLLAVDEVVERLPDLHVVEGRALRVHADHVEGVVAHVHLDLRILLERLDLLPGDVLGEVDAARLERLDPDVVLGHGGELDPVEVGVGGLPVVGVLDERVANPGLVRAELEGPGPARRLLEVAAARDPLAVGDDRLGGGEQLEERRAAGCLSAIRTVEGSTTVTASTTSNSLARVALVAGALDPLDVPLDVVGRERVAAVEADALPQVEHVGGRVRRFPAHGEPGLEHALERVAEEPLVDVGLEACRWWRRS